MSTPTKDNSPHSIWRIILISVLEFFFFLRQNFPLLPRLTLNSWSSRLRFRSAGIKGICTTQNSFAHFYCLGWLKTLMSNGTEAGLLNKGANSCGGRFVGTVNVWDPLESCRNLILRIPSLSIAYTRMGVAHVLTRHRDRSISRSGLVNHGCY